MNVQIRFYADQLKKHGASTIYDAARAAVSKAAGGAKVIGSGVNFGRSGPESCDVSLEAMPGNAAHRVILKVRKKYPWATFSVLVPSLRAVRL